MYNYLDGSMLALLPALLALGALMMALVVAAYVYFAWAFMVIAQKLKYKKAWLAWIPLANISMIFQLGGFHWAWIFLLLVPVVGWIAVFALAIISTWKIFKKRKYSEWLSLVPILCMVPGFGIFALIAYAIIIGFVAWK